MSATNVPGERIVATFAAQSTRLQERLQQLSDQEWEQPTRCAGWNARELLHHLVTATERAIDLLDPVAGPNRLTFSGMDPLSTPESWMRREGRRPAGALLLRYRSALDCALERAAGLAAESIEFSVHAPLGRMPWQLFLLHGLWDSWLHERDVFVGTRLASSPDDHEARLIGTYCLFMASEAARLGGLEVTTTVRLTGPGGGTWRLEVGETTRVRLIQASGLADIVGSAVPVFEAVCGRGAPLATVAEGEPALVGALSALGNFLRSAD